MNPKYILMTIETWECDEPVRTTEYNNLKDAIKAWDELFAKHDADPKIVYADVCLAGVRDQPIAFAYFCEPYASFEGKPVCVRRKGQYWFKDENIGKKEGKTWQIKNLKNE